MAYTPRYWQKDGDIRLARSIDDEVRFTFDGWTLFDGEIVIDQRSGVTSFNARTGAVVLTAGDIAAAGGGGSVTDSGLAAVISSGTLTPAAINILVDAAVNNLISGAPGALNTLKELADALGDDPNFATTITTLINSKLSASGLSQALLDRQAEIDRALRPWFVAQGTADTAAVDVLFTTGDSITEGAYATGTGAWEKRYVGVFNDLIRRALQPAGIPGGSSYYGFGSNLILSGAGFIGGTGTITQDPTRGLGLKSYTLSNGAVYSYYFVGDAADLLYSTDPSYGSLAITVDGVSAGTVNQTAAASSGNKKRLTGVGNGVHTVVLTSTGTTNIEGSKPYNGDTAAGYRVWEAGHSGYGAHDFQTQTGWANSVPAIPNVKLVVMSGNSNDYYAGRSKAQCKTDTLANIALLRSKISTGEFSIVLISYYDRPVPGGTTTQWQDFVDAYDEIAAADDLVTHIKLDPVFGHKTSDTDTRGGLVNNTDYVHPTNAGHKVIGKFVADFVLPKGAAAGGPFNNTADASKPVSSLQAIADTAAAAGLPWYSATTAGALSLAALPIQNYILTLNGAATLSPSGMPPVTAGRTAVVYIRYVQDATGSRTLTHNSSFRKSGAAYPVLVTTPTGSDLLRYIWDGSDWWVESISNPTISAVQQTAITAASGDATASLSATGVTGALAFGATTSYLNSYRVTLSGNATLSTSGMPVTNGKSGTYRVMFTQDATGSRTLTLTGFLRAAGVSPVLSTTANAKDLIEFYYDGASWWVMNFVKGGA